MQRLRASFDYVKKQYTYYCWREFRNTQDWEKDFAEDMFFRGGRGDRITYNDLCRVTVFPMQQLSPTSQTL